MEEYLELISLFLQREESCFLPGWGTLGVKHIPSIENSDSKAVLPPFKSVFFKSAELPTSGQDAKDIIQEAGRYFGWTEEEATTRWEKEALPEIKKTLKENKELIVPGLGQLFLKNGDKIGFKRFDQDRFLYSPISLKPEKENLRETEIPTESVLEDPYVAEGEEGIKTNWFWIVLIAAISLAIVGYFVYPYLTGTGRNSSKTSTSMHETKDQPERKDALSVTSDSNVTAQNQAVSSPKSPLDSIHFAVVYGVYSKRDIAKKQYDKMRGWGHQVDLFQKDSTTFYVGYSYYELPADTTKRLKEIKHMYGENSFILRLNENGELADD